MTTRNFRLESKDGRQTSVLTVENSTILVSWRSFGDSGSATHRLSTLSPDFTYHESFRGNPALPFQLGIFGLLIIAFAAGTSPKFEEKPAFIILGGAVAAIGLLIALSRLPKTCTTLVLKNDESSAIIIDHTKFDPQRLDAFLSDLRQAIVDSQAQQHAGSSSF